MDLLSQTMQERARVKIERALSFSGGSADMDGHMLPKKMRTPRDQMSHRIIEKRRRDRMNNCLANLGQLIPVNYLKQGQGRIEKTEIIEMATQHIQQLQTQVQAMSSMERPCCQEKFLMGYKECRDEVMRFLVEMAGYEAADPFCLTLLKHLHNQSKKFVPESASSVYQSTHSPHAGGEFTMPQNAGEVGGLMRLSERSTDHPSTMTTASSKPSATSPVVAPTATWSVSSASPPQKNIYTDVNHYLNGPRLSTSCSPLCSDSGYSTPSVPCSKPPQSPQIVQNVPSPSDKSSGIGGTPSSSSSPETTMPDPESAGGPSGRSQAQQAYKFKNDIKQRFTSHIGNSFEKMQENEPLPESSAKLASSPEAIEKPAPRQENKESNPITTPLQIECPDISSVQPVIPTEATSWNKQLDASCPKKAKLSSPASLAPPVSSPNAEANPDQPKTQVPAFALHPMGSCYIPLVISTSVIEPFLRAHSSPLGICHPVSIPVNFNRPDPVILAKPKPEGQQKIEPAADGPTGEGGRVGAMKRCHDIRE